jgi:hypothetical protein
LVSGSACGLAGGDWTDDEQAVCSVSESKVGDNNSASLGQDFDVHLAYSLFLQRIHLLLLLFTLAIRH